MRPFAQAALFALGVWLCIRLLAAGYRVIDLWYAARTAWPAMARGLAGWGGSTLALSLLLRGWARAALLGGLVAYALFYPALYVLRRFLVRAPRAADAMSRTD